MPETEAHRTVPMFLQGVFLLLQIIPGLLIASAKDTKSTCSFPAIFNFGDSNSDTGGLSASSLTDPVGFPYGETFFEAPSGRYADGRLLIDFIAEKLGLPYVEPYMDALGGNFSHGANFATTLSTILEQNSTLPLGFYSPFSLAVQLRQFLQLKRRSQAIYQQGGIRKYMVPRQEYFSEALYTIDIGQNDLTAILFPSPNTLPENYLRVALQRFATVMKGIYQAGGRYFWIHNTGPLGCLPYVLVQPLVGPVQTDQTGCRIFYNALAKKYNAMLNETVVKLREELPEAALTLVDVYAAKYYLITHAGKYGFEHPLEACCGSGNNIYNYNATAMCGQTKTVNGVDVLLAKSCEDPRKRINWDGTHYTEAANKWVFDRISMGRFSDPPRSLAYACHQNCI